MAVEATPTAAQVIDTQRKDWNRVAPAWEKWDRRLEENMAFINYRLVADARLRPGQRVLDLGSGTGCPALLAAQAVGDGGGVVGLDLAEGMLVVARRKAAALNVSNVVFRTADITALPFESDSFDAVTSRFCLMFLPEIPKALAEIARVLKPAGYLAAAVWSAPDKNPFITIPIKVLGSYLTLPPPDPEQPGIFRLARQGDLSGMAERAGLRVLEDEELTGESRFDSADEYYDSLMDMAAPIQPLFAKLSAGDQAKVQTEIKREAERYRRGKGIVLPMAIRIVAARNG
ncbi:MAG TPA: methyltransferase domain-containing protein [Nitrospiria bacterium]|nr:methyltransferase domain-containing protein [Nitrospiria bacterium]